MKLRPTHDNSLRSAGVLARLFHSFFVGFFLLAVPAARAQGTVTNQPLIPNLNVKPDLDPNPASNLARNPPRVLVPNPPLLPPLPPSVEYKVVAPGVTLHQASPVLYFRGILGMSPAERERALANKSADYKKSLLAKVEEYRALPEGIREARLRQTQLRWELTTLTNLPPAERPAFIKEAAPEDRRLLEDFDRWQALSAAGKKELVDKLSPDRHRDLTRALAQWESVPETERQQRSAQFSQFFDLDQTQQQKALTTFTEAERQTMETALKRFAALPEAQRKICIQSFQEFASMDAAERDEFLKNAACWEAMTAGERSLWRSLVQTFPIMPPAPPGFHPVQYPGVILPPPLPPVMNPPALSTAFSKPKP
jgi:hypothetical protein